ncbi:uncharacterized protein LOC134183564 [Corticium candelabrum]|uniref:uncharacterized protein LOC134183564 n=1 Tax=Corticium candelabrum TaxID=121492 RepID=UPI002E270F2F|nr:uncharacterized protein LOC134183564 [Corticium candelabrum]
MFSRSMTASGHRRTVLLIGRTGNGKSACSNVIAGCDPSNSESQLFKESDGCGSETKVIHVETVTFTQSHNNYAIKIVDTIGLGDTDLSETEVLKCLANVCTVCKEGINVVFFVVGRRMTKEEADAWDIIWKIIFTADICKFTTLIRTQFPKFMEPVRVAADSDALTKCEKGSRVMKKVKKIIHVDNPPSDYPTSQATRTQSRELLLAEIIMRDEVYKPPQLDDVNERVSNYCEDMATAKERIAKLESKVERLESQSEIDKFRYQAELANEREKAVRAELAVHREMTKFLKERVYQHEAERANSSCLIL